MAKKLMPKGIIFDLDDTIIQFDAVAKPSWLSTCNYFTDGERIKDSKILFDAIVQSRKWYWSDTDRHQTGRLNLDKARRTIVNRALSQLSIYDESLAVRIIEKYAIDREKNMSFFPHAEETLHKIKNLGTILALVTNGESGSQRQKIDRFGLNRFFNVILIEGEVGVGKPDREVFLKALEKMKLGNRDVWFVGDDLERDVAGPQKLNIYAIWNDFRNRGLPPDSQYRPDRIINSISELV